MARVELTGEDEIVDLRPEDEASELIHWAARRIPPDALADTLVPGDRRLVLACASGLRAWRAAETLQHIWPGEIVLVAAGAFPLAAQEAIEFEPIDSSACGDCHEASDGFTTLVNPSTEEPIARASNASIAYSS